MTANRTATLSARQEQDRLRRTKSKPEAEPTEAPEREPDILQLRQAVAEPHQARPETILVLQQRYGNRAVQRLIQRKLRVGAADDPYEQEADRVAESVTGDHGESLRDNQASVASNQTTIQRQGEEEEIQTKPLTSVVQRQGEEEEIQTKRDESDSLVQRWTGGVKPAGPRLAAPAMGSAMPAAPTHPAPRPWAGGAKPAAARPAGPDIGSASATKQEAAIKREFDQHMAAGRHNDAVNYLKTVYHLDGTPYTLTVEALGAGVHAVTVGGWSVDGSRLAPIQVKVNDAYLIRQAATPEGYNKLVHTLGHEYQHVQQRNTVGWKGADTPADKARREWAAYSWEVLDAGRQGIAKLDRANMLSTIGKAKAEFARLTDADKALEQPRYDRLLRVEAAP